MNAENEWRQLYQIALLEIDWSKMEERIQAADSAITARVPEFFLNHGGASEENQAISDAVNALSLLRREVEWHRSKQAQV